MDHLADRQIGALARTVGREEADARDRDAVRVMEAVRDELARDVERGRGRAALIVGEPGYGKSLLLQELGVRLAMGATPGEIFQRIMSRDPRIGAKLAEQDEALDGKQGGLLRMVSAKDGKTLSHSSPVDVP